jgi:hypothetical protein
MAQNNKIVYTFSDNVLLEIEKGIRTIDSSKAVFVEITESDSSFTFNIIKSSILPDEMRNWVQLSNRVFYCEGMEIIVFFSIDLNFVFGASDVAGGYIIVVSKEGKVFVSMKQQ